MTLRVAIQMDPLESINPRSDSTLLLGVEACARGYEVFYYTPDKLTYEDGQIRARAHRVTLYDNPEHYFDLGETITLDLRTVDVVLLRQDPPFNMTYLTTTYLLEQLAPDVLVVNDPASVRNHPEKLFPTLLKHYMPPTLISADTQAIAAFHEQHQDIILKPLYGYGGRSILRVKRDDQNLNALMEMLFSQSKEPIIAQRFLSEVVDQDRRIVLMNGEVAGAIGRIPQAGDIRANMRVGGEAVKVELTPKQREICEALRQPLKEKGLLLVGLDVIGDWLTEINITSPTGLRPINRLYGLKLEAMFWDAVVEKKRK